MVTIRMFFVRALMNASFSGTRLAFMASETIAGLTRSFFAVLRRPLSSQASARARTQSGMPGPQAVVDLRKKLGLFTAQAPRAT